MANPTLDFVVHNLGIRQKRAQLVTHPRATSSVEEKRRLLDEPRYTESLSYGPAEICQGSVLSYTHRPTEEFFNWVNEKPFYPLWYPEVEEKILCIHDGRERIDFRAARFGLGLPRSIDLTFYEADIKNLTGLEAGAVSPFVTKPENLEGIYFDRKMIDAARQNHFFCWDISLSTTQSLWANMAEVYFALKQLPKFRDKTHIVRMT